MRFRMRLRSDRDHKGDIHQMRKVLHSLILMLMLAFLMGAVVYNGGKLADWWITIDYAHQMIHDGNHYVAFHNAPLASGGKYQLLINTPTISNGKIVHIIIGTRGSVESNIVLTESPTISNVGSAHTVINRNRNSSNTAGTIVTLAPTITGLGTVLLKSHFGSHQTGGEDWSVNEFNLLPGAFYLVNATSEAANNDLSVTLDFYEDSGDRR